MVFDMKSEALQTLMVIVLFILSPIHAFFNWNSSHTAEDWGAYQVRVCGRECQNNTLVYKYGKHYCGSPTCFPCDCDKHCSLLGTCCPKLNTDSNTYYSDIETSLDKNPLQWYKRLHCWKPTGDSSKHGYLSVMSCPLSWSDQEMRDKCEHPVRDSMDSVTPFSDRTTRLVFPNAHCAKCHGRQLQTPNKLDKLMDNDDDKLVAYPWKLKIECYEYQDLYNISDMFEFYQMSIHSKCRVKFKPPINESLIPTGCRFPLDMSLPYGMCEWDDRVLESLCHSLEPIPSLTVSGDKNIFCFTCNRFVPVSKYCVPIDSTRLKDEMLPPMYLLFNPHQPFSDVDTDVEECPSGHWRNDEGICILASCTPGKILDRDNETCQTAISDIKGLGYNLDMILVSLSHVETEGLEHVDRYIARHISKLGTVSDIDSLYMFKYCTVINQPVEYTTKVLVIRVKGYIIASENMLRDDVEGHFITSILQPWRFTIDYGGNMWNVTLRVISIGHDMADIYSFHENHERPQTDFVPTCFGEPQVVQKLRFVYLNDYVSRVLTKRNRFIDITPSLSCPFLAFNWTAHNKLENGSLVFSTYLRDRYINLTQDSKVSVVGGKLLLCLDLVKELTAGDGTWSESSSTDNILLVIQTYVDIVCTSVSVACLVVSFITYCLFPSLRSLPGLNNMCLCASLATAQTSLLITAIYGVRGRLNEIHCLIHAVVLHYSWLASFFWMNTCSIHMYRVFTSTRAINTWSVRKTHCRYCLYSFGIPLVLVFSTIIITSTTTGGDSIGYNDTICFLDVFTSTLTTILALLAPAALTMVINIILFGLTVREIVHVTRLQQSTRGSQGVMTYIKLSTVTGAFCAVATTAVLSQNQVLMIVASPLGSLMGFFIFISFVCNKHVGKLYVDLILRRPGDHSSGTSYTSKNTNRTTSTKISTQTIQT